MDIGLIYAQKHPLSEHDSICLTRENTIQKIQFDVENVVCVSGYIKELESKGRNYFLRMLINLKTRKN